MISSDRRRRPAESTRDPLADRERTASEVKSAAVSGVALMLGRGFVFRVLGLLGNLILARLLVPADFGVVAIGLAVVSVGQFLAGSGLGAAMIGRAEPPTRAELRAITGLQLAVTSAVGLIAAAVASAAGGAALVTAVMMLALPLTAIRAPAMLLISRRLEFSLTVRVEITEIVVYLGCAIAGAAVGLGAWSLAGATVVRAAAGSLVAVRLSPAGVVLPTWDLPAVRGILGFGARYQATSAIQLAHDVALTAGIAAVSGVTAVGLWSFTSRILQVPYLLFEALLSVGFPAFSRMLDTDEDPATIRDLLERGVSTVSVGVAAILCPMVAAAPAAVPLLFGDNWAGVSVILPGSAIALGVNGPIGIVLFGYLYATGDARTALLASLVSGAVRLAVTFSLLPLVGPAAIGIGWAVSIFAEMPIVLIRVRRSSGARLLRRVLPASFCATVGAGAGWIVAQTLGRTALSVLVSASLAGATFGVLMMLIGREELRRTLAMLRSARRALRRPVPVT